MKTSGRLFGAACILALSVGITACATEKQAAYVDAYTSASETASKAAKKSQYTITCEVLAIEEVSGSVKLAIVFP